MRPLFAIAPLAALLVVFGPTPHEANVALTKLWDQFTPDPDTADAPPGANEPARVGLATAPGTRAATPSFATTRTSLQPSLQR